MSKLTESLKGVDLTGKGAADEPRSDKSQPGVTDRSQGGGRRGGAGMDALMAYAAGDAADVQELKVDPALCRPWGRHNRFIELLDETSCADLIADIRANGQQDAAIVRMAEEGAEVKYEIISGARRWWVAKYLGTKLTIRVKAMNDEQSFIESNSANQYSDISPYERAVEYASALADLYEGNESKMARRLNIDDDKLRRIIAMAALDKEVVAAFGDPRRIAQDHAVQINRAVKTPGQQERMLEAARKLAKQQKAEPLAAATVVKALLDSLTSKRPATTSQKEEHLVKAEKSGKVLVEARRRGKKTVSLLVHLDADAKQPEIVRALKEGLEKVAGI